MKGLVVKTANVIVIPDMDNYKILVDCLMMSARNSSWLSLNQLSRFLVCTNWSMRFNAHTTKAENCCSLGGISEDKTHF
jgi:hypothetical protein